MPATIIDARATASRAVRLFILHLQDTKKTLSWRLSGPRTGRRRGCAAVVDAVEEHLERAVRLRAPQHLGAEENDVSFADGRVDDGDRLIEVLLAPRPTAPQR